MTTLILLVAFVLFYAFILFAALALAAVLDKQREEALNQFLRDHSAPPRASVADAGMAVSEMTDVRAYESNPPPNVVCMCGGLCPSCAIERSKAA